MRCHWKRIYESHQNLAQFIKIKQVLAQDFTPNCECPNNRKRLVLLKCHPHLYVFMVPSAYTLLADYPARKFAFVHNGAEVLIFRGACTASWGPFNFQVFQEFSFHFPSLEGSTIKVGHLSRVGPIIFMPGWPKKCSTLSFKSYLHHSNKKAHIVRHIAILWHPFTWFRTILNSCSC